MKINTVFDNNGAVVFCTNFINNLDNIPRYVFGCNHYAESILKCCKIDGFIDDFTCEKVFCSMPIYRTIDIPKNSLVVSAVIGSPLSIISQLNKIGIRNLDYFAFLKYSGLPVEPIPFWEGFKDDFLKNQDKYHWLYDNLSDTVSKEILLKLLNFRISCDIKHMEGFQNILDQQYFEHFLALTIDGEIFIDVGGFDGETSLQFIEICPDFREIHFFEPDKNNFEHAKKILSNKRDIHFYNTGLSDEKKISSFTSQGSISMISENADSKIYVDLLDNLLPESTTPTFIKIDIEGYERKALAGAKNVIKKFHPRLAISVYHKGDDLWRIADQVLSYVPDYKIYLRHYTEGVVETVMYFIEC